jgi:streptogramin lyase
MRRLSLTVAAAMLVLPLAVTTALPAHGATGDISEFPLPTHGFPLDITAGPDGNLWFTEGSGNRIGRVSTAGAITEFPVAAADSGPSGIAAGPDGNLWFTERRGNRIGRITPTGTITEFPLPEANSYPAFIAAGPDGNLWFTEGESGNRIGRISTAGTITEFPVPTAGSRLFGITAGPDGNLWFTEAAGNRIGRITPTGTITEFPLPTASRFPGFIAAGPDGNLWFTENVGGIGRITPAGAITEFTVPTTLDNGPLGITAGPDGNLWYTTAEEDGAFSRIGRITLAGSVTEFPLPEASSHPYGITAGPDGNLWFTESYGDRIGRLEVGGEGHHGLSFTPTSGKPGTLFKSTYTCSSGAPEMKVVNDDPAATATSDIDVHPAVTGDGGSTYTQPVVIGREGNYTARVTCGGVELGTAALHVVQALTYAGLGDSYSSGEGAPPANFIPPSDGTLNKCHRATTAWPMRIRTATNTTIDFAACSGAVIDDFQSFNVDNGKGFGTGNGRGFEVPQRDHISSKVTTLASLSVGGNDVGFPGVMVSCVHPLVVDCAGRADKSLNTAFSYLTDGRRQGCVNLPGIRPDGQPDRSCYDHDVPSLHTLYQDLAGRLAHGGRLVVTGYPLLFGDVFRSKKLGQPSCTINILGTGITDIYRSDARWLNKAGTRLNQTIQKEVLKAQAWAATNRPDVTIRFAPVSPAFDSHRLCDTKTPWINGLLLSGPITDLQYDGSFHPTPDGHAAIAAFIRPAFG